METLSMIELTSQIAAGFGILFFLGLILATALPEKPGTWDYATGGMPQTFTLWMMGIGALGLFIGYLVLLFSVLSKVPRLNIRNSRLKFLSPSESMPDFTRIHRRFIESPCDYVPDLYHLPAFRVNVPVVYAVC